MDNIQIKHITYNSSLAGKTLMITGAIHGDEPCGTIALNRLIQDLDRGKIALACGKLIIVPICNPMAYANKTRFVERNLNRYLFPKEKPQYYEDHIDPILCGLLQQADFLLDLHSYASSGGPFIFLSQNDGNNKETAFARDLGVQDFVYGWSSAYGGNNRGNDGGSDGGKPQCDKEGMGTTEYMRSCGGVAVTLECGQHLNEDAPKVGYHACLRAMAHLGLLRDDVADGKDGAVSAVRATDGTQETKAVAASKAIEASNIGIKQAQQKQRLVKMQDVFYRRQGANLAKEYQHFDQVSKGEAIAFDEGNNPIYIAPYDGCIVLPDHGAKIGSEWFYFGASDKFM